MKINSDKVISILSRRKKKKYSNVLLHIYLIDCLMDKVIKNKIIRVGGDIEKEFEYILKELKSVIGDRYEISIKAHNHPYSINYINRCLPLLSQINHYNFIISINFNNLGGVLDYIPPSVKILHNMGKTLRVIRRDIPTNIEILNITNTVDKSFYRALENNRTHIKVNRKGLDFNVQLNGDKFNDKIRDYSGRVFNFSKIYPNLKHIKVENISWDDLPKIYHSTPKLKTIEYSDVFNLMANIFMSKNEKLIFSKVKAILSYKNRGVQNLPLNFEKVKLILNIDIYDNVETFLSQSNISHIKKLSIMFRDKDIYPSMLAIIEKNKNIKKIKLDGNIKRWKNDFIHKKALSHSVGYLQKNGIKSFKIYTHEEDEYREHKKIFLNTPDTLNVYGLWVENWNSNIANEYLWLFLFSGLKKLHIRYDKSKYNLDDKKINGAIIVRKKEGIKIKRGHATKSLKIFYDNMKSIENHFSDVDINFHMDKK